jgi:transcriptional regulator GlxA family with amidase domain
VSRLVSILAFDDMEVLDYAGPYEVFNVAGELSDPSAFEVVSVGVTAQPRGRGGFTVLPTCTLEDAPVPDLLVVPGGAGTRRLLHDERVLDFVRTQAAEVEVLLSVCTGALVLARAGLLHDRQAATHHDAYEELVALDPTIRIFQGQRFLRSAEDVWTSGGISAGIDLSLKIVEELAGRAVRDAVVAEMEWGWSS